MSDNYGTGVSRVLDPTFTAFLAAIWQQGKPPCDAELNLAEQLAVHWDQTINLRGMPSGWLGNETNPRADFQTNVTWSNWFKFGRQRASETKAIQWASVNGWLVPVLATRTGAPPGTPNNTDTWNLIALDPPPANSGDYRVDFVFLEVWKAKVAPNPSTTNKPGAAYVYRYGNVEGGMSFVSDDIKDPAMGFETTQRVQLQHRIRVVTGLVGLTSYPDGFDPAVVKAKGAYLPSDPTAVTSYTFTNMRQELGDPGLWRAGDGTANSLGTVDGYVYAIPICVVFRRNSVSWNGEPSQNLNGAINRNPTAIDRTGVKTFSNTPLTAAAIDDAVLTFTLSTATNIALPASPATPLLIRVGDELMRYSGISGTTITITERGALNTRKEAHAAGVPVTLESSRPDGLYADQIAGTDILDLRHLVNPNGFDYQTLLRANLDKLLRGDLHGTWKYAGNVWGTYLAYQDCIGTVASLNVTPLDKADNIRQVFSDAATVQRIEAVIAPNSDPTPQDVNVTWTLGIQVQRTFPLVPSGTTFDPGDVLTIPVSQFKGGIDGSDQDQIRFVNDGATYAVSLRIDGMPDPLPPSVYTVTPIFPAYADDLVITLGPNFPQTSRQIYVTFHVLYGPGRGLSRRPHSLQSICYYNPGPDLMLQQEAQPTLNVPLRVAWAPTWTKYNGAEYLGNLPITAEAYADLGSKTVILSPFRRIVMPTVFRPLDGNSLWHSATAKLTGTSGQTTAAPNWTTTFTDLTANFVGAGVVEGDRIVFYDTDGVQRSYAIQGTVAATTLTLDRSAGPNPGLIAYSIYAGEGLMPTKAVDGTTSKWALTDPLDLFSGTGETNAAHRNIYVELPRHLVPTWGEVWTPIQHPDPDTGSFNEGVNFLVLSKKGAGRPNSEANYVPYTNGSWSSVFLTTWDLNSPEGPATYNTALLYGTYPMAGMQKFTDTRGRGRKGLELPPFYGVARLYAVYEAQDFKDNGGSSYNPLTREYDTLRATNLLRQNLDEPTFWIEIDDDGDSTFILNANAIDTSRCPNPITFDTGEFIIEASIFGFDRGTFDPDGLPRIVLTRGRAQLTDLTTRTNNVGWGTAPLLDGPTCVIPAPPAQSDKILINYSRTPYQGDAWGSQNGNNDVGKNAGPLTTGVAWQLVSLEVNENTVTSPYDTPKQLEVLASLGFATTLGTGRMSGEALSGEVTDPTNPGYENPSEFPPTGPATPRPRINSVALASGYRIGMSTEYLGCTTELPLGALFRDKDFRGGFVDAQGSLGGPLVYIDTATPAAWNGGAARASGLEQREVLLGNASCGSGEPGEVLVHVDGNDGSYGVLTNFRTFRGGSVFRGNGARPGGEFVSSMGKVTMTPGNIALAGRAMLVRNHVTNTGTEVSAGDELMLLIVTGVLREDVSDTLAVVCGTSGAGEGQSAADLYRIEGHPLTKDNTMVEIDPDAVTLARKIDVRV